MITIEVSPGELLDRLTILEIKAEQISDPKKLNNVRHETAVLLAARPASFDQDQRLRALTADLKQVNLALWKIEDDIRDCERGRDFGATFVELARAVYRTNDQRAALKRAINDHCGSKIVDEKSYAEY